MRPNGGGQPTGELAARMQADCGGVDQAIEALKTAGLTRFGSGWAWLVRNPDGTLAIEGTSNAGTPLTTGKKPLLTCDVWEHAYYVDYRNARANYVAAFWDLVNWDFVARQ